VQIEIWSDVVCPWCYIGKRRLETALSRFPHRSEVEIVWRSFQLDPTAVTEPNETVAEHLGRKYGGGPEAGLGMIERVEALAAEEGMTWRHREAIRVNTLDAHRLLHLALESSGPQVQGALKEALFAAYFVDAENIADHDVLRRLAHEVGLDADRVGAVLTSDEYRAEVMADQAQATAYGATGVPFFVVDRRYGVSGAQPAADLTQVLERAWADAHPPVQVLASGTDDGDGVCGPDGCAI
jgi:predicted DsbA family dithiol-disulfide isomerase